MTDLIERLRDAVGDCHCGTAPLLEAADEIERQQLDIDKLMSERDGWLQEIERLRAAVGSSVQICEDWAEKLLRAHRDDPTGVVDREWCAHRFRAARDEIARRALEPKP